MARKWAFALTFITFLSVLVSRSQVSKQANQERLAREQRTEEAKAALNPPVPRPATSCGAQLNLGFHIQSFSGGLRAAVWYPATQAESSYEYPAAWLSTAVARDAPVADCQVYPLVVYSHGLSGCGTIATFFTEALARAGYIVVAPDHRDSVCKVDQPYDGPFPITQKNILKPQEWTEATYRDRADDIRRILDEMPREPMFASRLDLNRIGGAGHSLGGYTIGGLIGGWSSWHDDRIRAAVLMSPYVMPFQVQKTLGNVHVPVLYQGGTLDIGVTPFLRSTGGAYEVSNSPKFLENIRNANHLDWSSFHCSRLGAVPACLDTPMARLINDYAIAFFNRYLKGTPEPILDKPNPALAEYRHSEQ